MRAYAGLSRMLLLRSATASRSTWLAFVTGFFEPVFYLLALGQVLRDAEAERSNSKRERPA